MNPNPGEPDPQHQPPAAQPWDAVPPAPEPAPAAPSHPAPDGYGSAPGGYGQPPAQPSAQQPTTSLPPVSDQTQVLPSQGPAYGSAPAQQQPYGQQPTTALPAFGAAQQQPQQPYGAPQGQYGQPAPQYPQQTAPGQPQYAQPGQYQQGPPGGYPGAPLYGAPGQTPPKKSKAGLFAVIAVVAVLVIGGLAFFLANGPLSKTVLDNSAVASTIERQAENNDIDVSGVSCPANQEVKADATFTCSSDDGDITVTITSDDGDWEWSLS